MVHRAICGSMERFAGILIEHFAGHFPLWLAPVQAVVATITSDADAYAEEVVGACAEAGLRVEADLRNEKITYKVREHSLAKVPVLLVVGRKEAAERTVSIRRLGSPDQTSMSLDEALRALAAEAVAAGSAARAAAVEAEPERTPDPRRPPRRRAHACVEASGRLPLRGGRSASPVCAPAARRAAVVPAVPRPGLPVASPGSPTSVPVALSGLVLADPQVVLHVRDARDALGEILRPASLGACCEPTLRA